MKLVIISATPMAKSRDGESYSVFEPTLREVEYLAVLFDEVVWYGFPNGKTDSLLYRIPNNCAIKLRVFPNAIGGQFFWEKLAIIPRLPLLILKIGVLFSRYRYIHTRGPSLPAWIAILFSKIYRNKSIWHKYAGNWNQLKPPLSYRIQRALLKQSQYPVTVNGFWSDTNPNILSFVNPCFSQREFEEAVSFKKSFESERFEIVFVGRIEHEKGVFHVLEAAKKLTTNFIWYIVGEGKEYERVKEEVSQYQNIHVLGALNRAELNQLYARCHFFVLPTVASEGFPKVISEAAGFGCIPIVSSVSSISQYVKSEFGSILVDCSGKEIENALQALLADPLIQQKSDKAKKFASIFTYERYVERIRDEVLLLSAHVQN